MGLKYKIKTHLIKKAMDKKKLEPFDVEEADKFVLPSDAESGQNDSHYFMCHNQSKEGLFYRYARRGGDEPSEIWFVFKDDIGNVYLQHNDKIEKGFAIPSKVECVTPGKVMRFFYSGLMYKGIPTQHGYVPDMEQKPVNAVLEGEFTAKGEAFEFSKHMSSNTMARSMAKSKLDKQFRDSMSEMHQIHYEQSGVISASITIDKKTFSFDNALAIRDHSFGKRDWDFFCRYIWIAGILENGDFINTSLIRYPSIKELQTGFYMGGGTTTCLANSTSMDDITTIPAVPESFTFFVDYENGDKKKVDCRLDFAVPFTFANDNFMVNEGFSEFIVNGIKGKGITEFAFHANESKWKV